jgi:CHAT domain-containing protein
MGVGRFRWAWRRLPIVLIATGPSPSATSDEPPAVHDPVRARVEGGRHARSFDPLLASGLVLAGANTRTREGDDDGMLTAPELLSFDLESAELVFLPACETARGIKRAGDGVHGLVRAVTLAGARAVVASHWPVDEAATHALVLRFHEACALSTRVPPAEARRTAARALRDTAPFSAPRHWAAFCAYGSAR